MGGSATREVEDEVGSWAKEVSECNPGRNKICTVCSTILLLCPSVFRH